MSIRNRDACKCKDCTKRYVGCHAECIDYKKFQESLKSERKERKNNAIFKSVRYGKKNYIDIRKKGKDK